MNHPPIRLVKSVERVTKKKLTSWPLRAVAEAEVVGRAAAAAAAAAKAEAKSKVEAKAEAKVEAEVEVVRRRGSGEIG